MKDTLNCKIDLIGHDRLMLSGNSDGDWFIAFSTDKNLCSEGSWQEWVALAKAILEENDLKVNNQVKENSIRSRE